MIASCECIFHGLNRATQEELAELICPHRSTPAQLAAVGFVTARGPRPAISPLAEVPGRTTA